MNKRGEDIGAVERIRGLIVKRLKEGTKEEWRDVEGTDFHM